MSSKIIKYLAIDLGNFSIQVAYNDDNTPKPFFTNKTEKNEISLTEIDNQEGLDLIGYYNDKTIYKDSEDMVYIEINKKFFSVIYFNNAESEGDVLFYDYKKSLYTEENKNDLYKITKDISLNGREIAALVLVKIFLMFKQSTGCHVIENFIYTYPVSTTNYYTFMTVICKQLLSKIISITNYEGEEEGVSFCLAHIGRIGTENFKMVSVDIGARTTDINLATIDTKNKTVKPESIGMINEGGYDFDLYIYQKIISSLSKNSKILKEIKGQFEPNKGLMDSIESLKIKKSNSLQNFSRSQTKFKLQYTANNNVSKILTIKGKDYSDWVNEYYDKFIDTIDTTIKTKIKDFSEVKRILFLGGGSLFCRFRTKVKNEKYSKNNVEFDTDLCGMTLSIIKIKLEKYQSKPLKHTKEETFAVTTFSNADYYIIGLRSNKQSYNLELMRIINNKQEVYPFTTKESKKEVRKNQSVILYANEKYHTIMILRSTNDSEIFELLSVFNIHLLQRRIENEEDVILKYYEDNGKLVFSFKKSSKKNKKESSNLKFICDFLSEKTKSKKIQLNIDELSKKINNDVEWSKLLENFSVSNNIHQEYNKQTINIDNKEPDSITIFDKNVVQILLKEDNKKDMVGNVFKEVVPDKLTFKIDEKIKSLDSEIKELKKNNNTELLYERKKYKNLLINYKLLKQLCGIKIFMPYKINKETKKDVYCYLYDIELDFHLNRKKQIIKVIKPTFLYRGNIFNGLSPVGTAMLNNIQSLHSDYFKNQSLKHADQRRSDGKALECEFVEKKSMKVNEFIKNDFLKGDKLLNDSNLPSFPKKSIQVDVITYPTTQEGSKKNVVFVEPFDNNKDISSQCDEVAKKQLVLNLRNRGFFKFSKSANSERSNFHFLKVIENYIKISKNSSSSTTKKRKRDNKDTHDITNEITNERQTKKLKK